jgi:ABC-type antimicrobial peptide transport system permease subunit
MFAITYDSESVKNKVISIFSNERAVLLSATSLIKCNAKIGDMISLTAGSKTYEYKIIGSIKSRADDADAVIPASYAMSDFGAANYGFLAYTAADPEAIIVQIRNLFGNTTNWSRTVKEFYADIRGTLGAFLEPVSKLTYFILLLAIVGVINNLIINYIQKRHSIAMYKAVGLSNRQNIKMTLIEGFSSGLIGASIGIIISYLEIKTIFLVSGPKMSVVAPKLDARVFITAGIMGITVTLIGSLVPILKGSKMKIVEEIKCE